MEKPLIQYVANERPGYSFLFEDNYSLFLVSELTTKKCPGVLTSWLPGASNSESLKSQDQILNENMG